MVTVSVHGEGIRMTDVDQSDHSSIWASLPWPSMALVIMISPFYCDKGITSRCDTIMKLLWDQRTIQLSSIDIDCT